MSICKAFSIIQYIHSCSIFTESFIMVEAPKILRLVFIFMTWHLVVIGIGYCPMNDMIVASFFFFFLILVFNRHKGIVEIKKMFRCSTEKAGKNFSLSLSFCTCVLCVHMCVSVCAFVCVYMCKTRRQFISVGLRPLERGNIEHHISNSVRERERVRKRFISFYFYFYELAVDVIPLFKAAV